MAGLGDRVIYRVAERHRTKTRKGGKDGEEINGSTFHHAYQTFAGVVCATVATPAPAPGADDNAKPAPPQFIIGLFVPDKQMAYVHASEGTGPGEFAVKR